jgi:hypothetical protein
MFFSFSFFFFFVMNHMSVVPFLGHSISITVEKNQVVMGKLHNFLHFNNKKEECPFLKSPA